MIQSRPKLSGNKLIVKSFSFIFLCVILYMFSSVFGKLAFLLQLTAIICATYSLFLLIKYVIPDYLYTLENGKLTIHKLTKTQSVCVADINISDAICEALTTEQYKASTYAKKVNKVYKFIKNPDSSDIRYLLFTNVCENYAIIIEPDDIFCRALNKEIENHKNTSDEEHNEEF